MVDKESDDRRGNGGELEKVINKTVVNCCKCCGSNAIFVGRGNLAFCTLGKIPHKSPNCIRE